MSVICVTGTAGTGKSTLAKKLVKELGYKYLDVKRKIQKEKLFDSYDRKYKSYIVDPKRLNRYLIKLVKNKKIIIDSLLSHYLPKKYVDLCVVTKCDLKELKKRLEKRKYPEAKVRENLDAEIFDICLNEAKEMGHYTFVVNTTKGIKNEVISQLLGEINAVESTGRRVKRDS